MRRKPYRVALIAALVAAFAMCAVPAVSSAATRTDKSQNKRIARQAKSIKKVSNALTALAGALANGSKGLDGRIKTIEDAAPVIISSLTGLKDGLIALKDGTTAGFNTVTNTFKAVEYGVTAVFLGPGGAGGALPLTVTSGDIPDDGNAASASGVIPISVGANPGQVPEDTLMAARSAIRSGESDGGATGDPAGYVGGLITMTCGGGPGAGGTCDADPGAGTTLVPPGAVLCIVGPPPNQSIDVPGVGSVPFPLVTIQQKADRTDTTKPDASSPNPDQGASAGAGSIVGALADDTGDGCRTGETGNTLLLNVQTQFVDIPTSLTPGPTD